jgi:Xaa-Pro dipeptidase
MIAAVPRESAFEVDEYRRRLATVQSTIEGRGWDALCLVDPRHVFYLTGSDSQGHGHLQCLVVPADGDPSYVTWDFEAGKVATSSWLADPSRVRWDYDRGGLSPDCWLVDVVTYSWFEDSVAVLAGTLQRLGLEKGRLGVELRAGGLPAATFERLRDALPGADLVDGYGVLERCRIRKSAAELAHIRAAAALTDRAVEVAYAAIRVGATDSEVAAALMASLYTNCSEPVCWGPIVASGYNAGIGHSSFVGRTLEAGDTVFLEFTGQVHRYVAPVMRTAVLGPATGEMQRLRDAGLAAVEAVLGTARPGVPAREVAGAGARALAEVAGSVYFHDVYGYMVGIGYPPSWFETLGFELQAGNEGLLEEGMVFHVPISLRRFGEFGVSQSQTIAVTATGAESLTRSDPALREL